MSQCEFCGRTLTEKHHILPKREVISISAVVFVLVLLLTLALSCGNNEGEPTPFSMQVIPERMEDAIAEQSCVFLVVVADE